jgi:hypothetical protein
MDGKEFVLWCQRRVEQEWPHAAESCKFRIIELMVEAGKMYHEAIKGVTAEALKNMLDGFTEALEEVDAS